MQQNQPAVTVSVASAIAAVSVAAASASVYAPGIAVSAVSSNPDVFNVVVGDDVTALDTFYSVVAYSRNFTDTATATDVASLHVNKVLDETVSVGDNLTTVVQHLAYVNAGVVNQYPLN